MIRRLLQAVHHSSGGAEDEMAEDEMTQDEMTEDEMASEEGEPWNRK